MLAVIVFIFYTYCRRVAENRRSGEENALSTTAATVAASGPGYTSNLRNVDNINLLGMLGSGKYGTVMKGLLHDQEVAVKIFPEVHQQYFVNELSIYSLPLMDSPALLNYLGIVYITNCQLAAFLFYKICVILQVTMNVKHWMAKWNIIWCCRWLL